MSERDQTTVSRLVTAVAAGDRRALDGLFAEVYDELHVLARRQRLGWRGNHTLNTTGLVHEAYLKLSAGQPIDLAGRAHFLALASRAMRQILVNYAESRRAAKRGGELRRVRLDDLGNAPVEGGSEAVEELGAAEAELLVALDGALHELERRHERQARVVEQRFFGGLTVEETAAALDVSPRTVKRDWAVAQAWLHDRLEGSRAGGNPDDA